MARRNRHRSGSGWDSQREDTIRRFGRLSPRERRARADADPLNGVKFLDYDATYDNLFQPVVNRPSGRLVHETAKPSAVRAAASIPRAAGTAFDPVSKGPRRSGKTGTLGPVKTLKKNSQVKRDKPKGKQILFSGLFVTAPPPAKRSPTARGGADRPAKRDAGSGAKPREVASAASTKTRAKQLGVALRAGGARAGGREVASRKIPARALAAGGCVPRPPGTTDNKNGRTSAAFVPWCKP